MKSPIFILICIFSCALCFATDQDSRSIARSLDREFGDFVALQDFEHSDGYGYSVEYGYLVDKRFRVRVFVYDLNKDMIEEKDLKAEFDRSVAGVMRDFGELPGFEVIQSKEGLKVGDEEFAIHVATFKQGNASNSIVFTTANDKFLKLAVSSSRDGFDRIKPAALRLLEHVIEKTENQ